MQYTRYEEDIVQRYGIELRGWTYEKLINPSDLSSSVVPLQFLREAIITGTCKFVKLTAAERKVREAAYTARIASGEVQVRKRKRRSDAGTKKSSKRKKRDDGNKSDEIDEDEEDEEDEEDAPE